MGALASPRNRVFQSGHHLQRKRGLSPQAPPVRVRRPHPAGVACSPSLVPGGHPSLVAPYLLTSAGHPPGHLSLSGHGLTVGPSIPGRTCSMGAHLETSGQLPCGAAFLACPGTGPKKGSKPAPPRASQTPTHPLLPPLLGSAHSVIQGPVWREGVSMTPLFQAHPPLQTRKGHPSPTTARILTGGPGRPGGPASPCRGGDTLCDQGSPEDPAPGLKQS